MFSLISYDLEECHRNENSCMSELSKIRLGEVFIGGISVTQRAFAELAKSFTSAHAAINGVTIKFFPAHSSFLLCSIFEVIKLGESISDIINAPSYLKSFALLEVIQSSGHILDYFNSGVWLAEQFGTAGLEAIKAVSIPLTATALGLQSVGIGIASWKIYEICRVWNKVEKHWNDIEYDSAINVLVAEPSTPIKKFRDKFFGILDQTRKDIINNLFNIVKNDEPARTRLFDSLKDHYFHKKIQASISLALMIIGVVGVALGSFAAVAITPIGWGILGVAAVLSIGLLAYNLGEEYQFLNSLRDQINSVA